MSNESDEEMKEPLIKKKEKNDNKEVSLENSEDNVSHKTAKEEIKKIEEKHNEKVVRKNKLTGKVYFVFFIQSLIVFLFIYYAFNNEAFKKILQKNRKFFYVSIILAAIIMAISRYVKIFSVKPFNYFFFLIFSVSISIIVCKFAILFSFKTMVILWTLLVFMILSLSIYAFFYKKEIQLISTSFIVFIVLSIISLIIKFLANVSIIDSLIIVLSLVIFSVYLIYDVNKLIEEKQITSKDYFLLNILLYFDIIMHFVKLIYFIHKNLQSDEKNETLETMKNFAEDLDKGIKEVDGLGNKNDGDKKKKKGKKKEDKKKKGKKKPSNKDGTEEIKKFGKEMLEEIIGKNKK